MMRTFIATALLLCVFTSGVSYVDAEEEAKKYEFKIETVKAQPVMSIRFKVEPTTEKITAAYGKAFTAIYTHVVSSGVEPSGQPFGRYHSAGEKELDIEAGLPVPKALEEKGDIKARELPAGKVVTTIHRGPYEQLSAAHEAIQEWVKKKGHKTTGGVWEVYVTDPSQEQDKSKWQTKLFLPISDKKVSK